MLPPLSQQFQIVEEIEFRFAGSEALEKAIDESLTRAEALRQSILKQAFEGISEGIKERIIKIIFEIRGNEGIKAKELAITTEVSVQTIERDINLLKKLDLVEFKGSKKLGGYHLSDKMKRLVTN